MEEVFRFVRKLMMVRLDWGKISLILGVIKMSIDVELFNFVFAVAWEGI